ncbi:MAG: response regulator [Pseudomonadales bacterium]|nr:response regulator [Pseudomonadales bacterium]
MKLNSTTFSEAKISILLVDDHELVRAGVARMLGDEDDMYVIGEAGSGEEAVEFVKHHAPDIVLMDARMPGIGGIEATHSLVKISPQIKIIAMSSVASGVIPSQMLRAGAMSFITKSVGVEEMLKAVRMVQDGQHYVTPEVATQLALDPFNQKGGSLFDKLSRREMQIAQMLTDGKKVSQISQYLDLSPKTVYSYRYRIFEKLGIRSDVELTILAVKHGLTDDARDLEKLPQLDRVAS